MNLESSSSGACGNSMGAHVPRCAVNMPAVFGGAAEGADQFKRLRIMRPASVAARRASIILTR
jgi:hypothetical protein